MRILLYVNPDVSIGEDYPSGYRHGSTTDNAHTRLKEKINNSINHLT